VERLVEGMEVDVSELTSPCREAIALGVLKALISKPGVGVDDLELAPSAAVELTDLLLAELAKAPEKT